MKKQNKLNLSVELTGDPGGDIHEEVVRIIIDNIKEYVEVFGYYPRRYDCLFLGKIVVNDRLWCRVENIVYDMFLQGDDNHICFWVKVFPQDEYYERLVQDEWN